MTLEDPGNLGDFVGGLAVIVTLIYLALQIRQSNILVRSSAEQTTRSDFQQAYTAHRAGTQSEDTWGSQWRALQFFAPQPGVRYWWERQGQHLIPVETEFFRIVAAEMKKQEGVETRDV